MVSVGLGGRNITLLLIILLVVGTVFGGVPLASAIKTECTGTRVSESLDNVVVPKGETCNIQNSTVSGDIVVKGGATLIISSGSTVDGDVTATKAELIGIASTNIGGDVVSKGSFDVLIVSSATIDGNVLITKTTGRSFVQDSTVGGDVIIENQKSALAFSGALIVSGSIIGGSVQVIKNEATFMEIKDNIIGGNLECEKNNPLPAIAFNMVTGSTVCESIPGGGGGV